MTDACKREPRQLRRGAHPSDSQKATQIALEAGPPSQARPDIRDLLREAWPALTRQWAVVAGDPRQHNPDRSGQEAVDHSLAVVTRSPEAVCRFAMGVESLFPHSASNRRKNGATTGQLRAKTGPKVSKTDRRAVEIGLPGRVLDRTLAIESHAAETFVNKSFRSSLGGCTAAQLTFGNGVQGGLAAHCLQLL